MKRAQAALQPINKVNLTLSHVPNVKALSGSKVLVVPIAGTVFASVVTSIQRALASAHVVTQECDGQGNPSTMASCMGEARAIGAKAVITVAVPYQLVPSAYEQLVAEHIPTLAAFPDPTGEPRSRFLASTSPTDPQLDLDALEPALDYIIWKTGGHGHILYLGASGNPAILAITQKSIAYLRSACPHCSVQAKEVATTEAGQIPSLVSAFLLKNPDTNYAVAQDTDVEGQGVATGAATASKANLPFCGSGTGNQGLQLISQGPGRCSAAFSANFLGWSYADALFRLIAGRPQLHYPYVGRLFDSSNISGLTFTAADAVTPKWFGAADYPKTFLAAWGL